MTIQEEPFFNLKAVVQQTGLKPDTLRAWERRYGLPEPERSEGGHRLYSQRDIQIVKWLMARQREGLSISRAVELWQQLAASGRDPLGMATPISTQATPAPPPGLHGETVAGLRQSWTSACLAYDEQRAEQVLAEAFALYPPEVVAVEVLQSAVAEIGDGWYRGEVTVQQEHFCSGLAIRRLEALVMAAPPPTRPGRILVACPPEDYHVIGLLLLTFLLRRRGWEVIYLGANVPADRLETTIEATDPHLVILGAQQLHSAANLLDLARILHALDVQLAYGGLIFNLVPDLRERIPGHFLGERLDRAPQAVEQLMTAPKPPPEARQVPEELRLALDHYLEQQRMIEAELERQLNGLKMAPRHLSIANRELSANLEAALALGSVEYLGGDIAWVLGLMDSRGMPSDLLPDYLGAYQRAAGKHLDERGAPILEWLARVSEPAGQAGAA